MSTLKKIRVTIKASKDFEFYLNCELDLIGNNIVEESFSDPNGYSALEAYYSIDTLGKKVSCKEIEVLNKVMRTKKSINLQIKMWAEDIAKRILFKCELEEYCQNYPSWVFEAVINQSYKYPTMPAWVYGK
jgi:hypothetical protein